MVDTRSKVVPLKSGSGSGNDRSTTQPLPAALARLHERLSPQLLQLTQGLFDQADDALFELADRAVSNAEQNVFFESMREVRIRRRNIEQGMTRRLREGLYQLAYGGSTATASLDLEEVSSNSLSLVGDEELEELVAADGMAAKGEKQFAEALQTLTLRLDTLANHQKVTVKTNPLSPMGLCQFFIEECRPLEIDIKAKLVLFKLFDRQVVAQLGEFYRQANHVLSDAGILPGLVAGEQERPVRRRSEAAAEADGDRIFSQLSQLLSQVRSDPIAGSGLAAPGSAPALPRDALTQILVEVQRRQIQQLMGGAEQMLADPSQLNVLQGINQVLQAKLPNRSVSIGQSDDDAINLVSMLFQFILDDRNLATPIKGLLARLQIPILRLAMQDKSFFGKGGHPARKLLNEVATASLGWTPSGPLENDPFYQKVDALVGRLLDEFDGDVGLFQEVLADFVSFVEMERRRANLVERRTVDAEDGRARAEVARAEVQRALDEKVAGRTLPRAIVQLLEDGRSHVLFLTCLREGTDSESWHEALATVDEVLDSVRPVTDATERAQLIRRLPALLKQLRTGLTKIGFNPYDMNRLFADLERIHLARLKQPEVTPAPDVPTLDQVLEARNTDLDALDRELDAALDGSAADLDEFDVAAEEPVAESAAEAPAAVEPEVTEAPVDPVCLGRVDALSVGCWVEFTDAEQKVVRCRLAAIIKATGKYIFVNRAGVKVAEETRESLARLLEQAQVKFLDEGQLFDRALESVIGNLRDMKRRH